MADPLVSIIVPCYNAAPWIEATLESALAQTWPNKEIIVIDDGSSDDSLARARTFEARGVRVLTQANAGAGAARNHGLREARGDYIQFLDADDLLSPDKVERQVRLLQSAPPGCVASCAWGRFESDPAHASFVDTAVFRDLGAMDFLILGARDGAMMQPAAWLTPRHLIDTAGPWDETRSPNDDGEFFCRVLLAGAGIRFSAAGRVYYRTHASASLRRPASLELRRGLYHSYAAIAERMLQSEDSPRVHAALANLFQRYVYTTYPEPADLVALARREVQRHGGSQLSPPMGGLTKLLASLLGWKIVWRLKRLVSR